MRLVLTRHGQTPGNGQRRYVGALDQPLSAEGRDQARRAGAHPDVGIVYVSCLQRTHETASIMFPHARQVVVAGIQEMDFGCFAGRAPEEMENDADYRAWVEGGCEGACPGGESKEAFTNRVCDAMEDLLRGAFARGEQQVYVVAHGGTMMASLSRFADEQRGYYEWLLDNCESYVIEVDLSGEKPVFHVEKCLTRGRDDEEVV